MLRVMPYVPADSPHGCDMSKSVNMCKGQIVDEIVKERFGSGLGIGSGLGFGSGLGLGSGLGIGSGLGSAKSAKGGLTLGLLLWLGLCSMHILARRVC